MNELKWSTFGWLLRHGYWHWAWNWDELLWGAGVDWYDGPIHFLNAGIFSVCLIATD